MLNIIDSYGLVTGFLYGRFDTIGIRIHIDS
jgi:hypothetical protein